MTSIGFTGTREGMTNEQFEQVLGLVRHIQRDSDECDGHHGDCLGSDAQFDGLCFMLGIFRTAHPPTNPKLRAYCPSDLILDPLPYHERNHAIVRAAKLMIATPRTMRPYAGSGTWATARYSELSDVPCFIVYPDGTVDRLPADRLTLEGIG